MALQRWHQDFLEELRTLGNSPPWSFCIFKSIRRIMQDKREECPIEAVLSKRTGDSVGLSRSETWPHDLGLTAEQVKEIMNVADNVTYGKHYNGEFRAALLEVTGLHYEEDM